MENDKAPEEAAALCRELLPLLGDLADREVVLCPPFTALASVKAAIEGTDVALGAQNVFYEDSGAYTGEVSPPMLKALGVKYVIIGHSERREYFGEADEMVNRKVKAALATAKAYPLRWRDPGAEGSRDHGDIGEEPSQEGL